MNKIAHREKSFRRALFEEASAKMGLSSSMIEKDFWVCWILNHLFQITNLKGHLVFKGGTTLSKIHNVIRRFSEDIDLTLDRHLFGFGEERNPDHATSTNKRKKLAKEMVDSCREYIQH